MSYKRPKPAFKHKKLSDFFPTDGDYWLDSYGTDYTLNKKELTDKVKPSEELAEYMKENLIYGDDSKKVTHKEYYFSIVLTSCGSYDLYVKYNKILGSRLIGEGLEAIK